MPPLDVVPPALAGAVPVAPPEVVVPPEFPLEPVVVAGVVVVLAEAGPLVLPVVVPALPFETVGLVVSAPVPAPTALLPLICPGLPVAVFVVPFRPLPGTVGLFEEAPVPAARAILGTRARAVYSGGIGGVAGRRSSSSTCRPAHAGRGGRVRSSYRRGVLGTRRTGASPASGSPLMC